jgi:DNA-binding transcriptional LysR family regulator
VTWAAQAAPPGLLTGEVDLFAGYVDRIGAGFNAAPLYDEGYRVLIRAGHPALRGGALDLDGWLSADHVVVSAEADGPTRVDRALADLGRQRRVALRVSSALQVPAVVAASDLVALLDARLAARLARAELLDLPPPLALPRSRVRVVWSEDALDPGRDWLATALRAAAV